MKFIGGRGGSLDTRCRPGHLIHMFAYHAKQCTHDLYRHKLCIENFKSKTLQWFQYIHSNIQDTVKVIIMV